jgi:protein transport protein SEC61 subunit beta
LTPREPSPETKQVVVLMMSVCFIAFVTMLHAVSKIYQYTSS